MEDGEEKEVGVEEEDLSKVPKDDKSPGMHLIFICMLWILMKLIRESTLMKISRS